LTLSKKIKIRANGSLRSPLVWKLFNRRQSAAHQIRVLISVNPRFMVTPHGHRGIK